MAVAEGKKRIYVTLETELVDILQRESVKNRRYPSDEIAILIEQHLKPKYELTKQD